MKCPNPPVFQDAFKGSGSDPPPLKEDKLCQAVDNLYALLKAANPDLKLEWLEIAFTRLDTYDRQAIYSRFLTVRLKPSPVAGAGSGKGKSAGGGGGGGGGMGNEPGGFSIVVGEWQDDEPTEDISKFTDHAVGTVG